LAFEDREEEEKETEMKIGQGNRPTREPGTNARIAEKVLRLSVECGQQ
jgi:hypothetical protein